MGSMSRKGTAIWWISKPANIAATPTFVSPWVSYHQQSSNPSRTKALVCPGLSTTVIVTATQKEHSRRVGVKRAMNPVMMVIPSSSSFVPVSAFLSASRFSLRTSDRHGAATHMAAAAASSYSSSSSSQFDDKDIQVERSTRIRRRRVRKVAGDEDGDGEEYGMKEREREKGRDKEKGYESNGSGKRRSRSGNRDSDEDSYASGRRPASRIDDRDERSRRAYGSGFSEREGGSSSRRQRPTDNYSSKDFASAAPQAVVKPVKITASSSPIKKLAGKPDVLALIRQAWAKGDRNVQWIYDAFPYELDDFQKDAIRFLSEAKSLVVSAPTGSGKTVIGEGAIYLAIASGMRAFYTTPLKALSNQKFSDFQKQFGEDKVGLLTGDTTINRDAQVVVMTTEIYRNMLYAAESGDMVGGISGHMGVVDDVFAVVFDEFHYMNDRERGTVWEEATIISPPHILLVALSATIANTVEVKDWFSHVHGPTELVTSDYRPVPLNFGVCRRRGLEALFEPRTKTKSEDGKPRRPVISSTLLDDPQVVDVLAKSRFQQGSSEWKNKGSGRLSQILHNLDIILGATGGYRRSHYAEVPSYPFIVRCLRRKDLLPAIIFIFSRDGCDRAAMEVSSEDVPLVTEKEAGVLNDKVNAFLSQHPNLVNEDRITLARQGIASHHAGMLPLWKCFVEDLFQQGLIKVVFATETLAAGINMPARTTVISSLSKRSGDEGHALLTTSQVLQMAGRAGRRGKDLLGHAIFARSPFEGPLHAYYLLTKGVDALESKFTPSYGMVLNLMKRRSLKDSQILLEKSFGNFLKLQAQQRQGQTSMDIEDGSSGKSKKEQKQERMMALFNECKEILGSVDIDDLIKYQKFREKAKVEMRNLNYMQLGRDEYITRGIEEELAFASPGSIVLLQTPSNKIASISPKSSRVSTLDYYLEAEDLDMEILMEQYEQDASSCLAEKRQLKNSVLLGLYPHGISEVPYYVVVTDSNTLYLVNASHIAAVSKVSVSQHEQFKSMMYGDEILQFPDSAQWKKAGSKRFKTEGTERTTIAAKLLKAEEELARKELERKKSNRSDPSDSESKSSHPSNHVLHHHMLLSADTSLKELEAAIEEQKEHLLKNLRELTSLELNSRPDRLELIKAGRAYSQLYEKYGKLDARKKGLAASDQEDGDGSTNSRQDGSDFFEPGSWQGFMSVAAVLQEFGYLDENYKVTSLGKLGAAVRTENEIWLSTVLMSEEVLRLQPQQLAAVLAAVIVDSRNRGDAYMDFELSRGADNACTSLLYLANRVISSQEQYSVSFPAWVDKLDAAMAETWASGLSWEEFMSRTSLQEGDVCRKLRRVMDVLRQIPHLPLIPDSLRLNARRAVTLMDRFPVTDSVTYSVDEKDKARGEDITSLRAKFKASVDGKWPEKEVRTTEVLGEDVEAVQFGSYDASATDLSDISREPLFGDEEDEEISSEKDEEMDEGESDDDFDIDQGILFEEIEEIEGEDKNRMSRN